MDFKVGDKVCLKENTQIKGVIVSRPEKASKVSFFDNSDIIWVDSENMGLSWTYKDEVLPVVEPVPSTPVQEIIKSPVIKAKAKAKTKVKAKAPKVPVETVDFRRLIAVDIIRKQSGRFFTAIFTGKDGVSHVCNGRTGVHKYLKGEVAKQLPADLLNAFNVKKMAYRNIFLDGISEIRAEGKIFTFNKES